MDTQEIDLSQYKWNGDWEWLQKTRDAGNERIAAQIGYLSEKVQALEVGDRISVIEICSNPEYYEICVKILCVIITSWRSPARAKNRDFSFNDKYTEVRRVI